MKFNMKRSLAVCTAILSLGILSCGTQNEPVTEMTDTVTESVTETEAVTTADPRMLVSDDLPEEDYGGYAFRLYTWGDYLPSYDPAGTDGELVNDAVFNRNSAVEDRFNVNIVALDSGAATVNRHEAAINTSILAGNDDFDIAISNGKNLCGMSLSHIFMNLYDIPHLNFEKPWWSEHLVEDLTFMDCMYIFSNNISYEEFAASKVFYFNKELVASFDLDSPYDHVFDGSWTIDRLKTMIADVYSDVNGDGVMGEEDRYGFLSTISHNAWAVSFDIPVWEKHEDGIELAANSERMLTAFEIIKDLYFNNPNVHTYPTGAAENFDAMRSIFMENRAMFYFSFLKDAAMYLRDTDVEYGILPFPKYDEQQKNYRVFYGTNSSNMFAVPVTTEDATRTGIIIEALSAEGYRTLIPAYYNTSLKDKYLRDEESVRILDIITENRTISFSYCYDGFSCGLGFGNAFGAGQMDYASFYAAKEASVLKRIAKVAEAFTTDVG